MRIQRVYHRVLSFIMIFGREIYHLLFLTRFAHCMPSSNFGNFRSSFLLTFIMPYLFCWYIFCRVMPLTFIRKSRQNPKMKWFNWHFEEMIIIPGKEWDLKTSLIKVMMLLLFLQQNKILSESEKDDWKDRRIKMFWMRLQGWWLLRRKINSQMTTLKIHNNAWSNLYKEQKRKRSYHVWQRIQW